MHGVARLTARQGNERNKKRRRDSREEKENKTSKRETRKDEGSTREKNSVTEKRTRRVGEASSNRIHEGWGRKKGGGSRWTRGAVIARNSSIRSAEAVSVPTQPSVCFAAGRRK